MQTMPDSILMKFDSLHKFAESEQWGMDGEGNYWIDFSEEGVDIGVVMDPDGTKLKQGFPIAENSLPQGIMSYITSEHPYSAFWKAYEMETYSDNLHYVVILEYKKNKKFLEFTKEGVFSKQF